MSKFIKSAAAAAVLATSATGTHAATLSTDVDVSLPSIVALYCFDSVSVGIDAGGLTTALNGLTSAGLGEATINSFAADLGADADTGIASPATTVNLDLTNVCAFRALVANGVTVTVEQAADPTLANATPGAEIDADGISLLSAASVTTGLGLAATPTPISVRVPLDLANATAPGSYSKSDLFTVTVVATP